MNRLLVQPVGGTNQISPQERTHTLGAHGCDYGHQAALGALHLGRVLGSGQQGHLRLTCECLRAHHPHPAPCPGTLSTFRLAEAPRARHTTLVPSPTCHVASFLSKGSPPTPPHTPVQKPPLAPGSGSSHLESAGAASSLCVQPVLPHCPFGLQTHHPSAPPGPALALPCLLLGHFAWPELSGALLPVVATPGPL